MTYPYSYTTSDRTGKRLPRLFMFVYMAWLSWQQVHVVDHVISIFSAVFEPTITMITAVRAVDEHAGPTINICVPVYSMQVRVCTCRAHKQYLCEDVPVYNMQVCVCMQGPQAISV